MKKLALKRLTKSDLTFFEPQYRLAPGSGNQKSINLNKNVFVDLMFPVIDEISGGKAEFKVSLTLYGPGAKHALTLQRKVIKGETYKNWRLNGEFVFNPLDDSNRFNSLLPNDIAIIEFEGTATPERIRMFILSQTDVVDQPLYKGLAPLIGDGRSSMVLVELSTIQEAAGQASVSPSHPVNELFLDNLVFEAAQQSSEATRRLARRKSGKAVSQDELKVAKALADAIGFEGEQAVAQHFDRAKNIGKIDGFYWMSRENAVAPYDFTLIFDGISRSIEVKSTRGSFDNPIHLSGAELFEAVHGGREFDIYRIYSLSPNLALLRIAANVGPQLRELESATSELPLKVRIDSLTIPVTSLKFGNEVEIVIADDEESTIPATQTSI